MPYQLIYTSAARLLDSPLSGYGTVARSEKMSPLLVSRLVELSEYKEPAEQGILGPQFSYRIEECGNALYHIFTSVRSAGADYSKRSCHIAHHLILPDEEMHSLCRSATPPTPAGILLSLELNRFWVHRWQREPEYLPESSAPSLADMPSADNFPTWLVFTGSADNAQAFQTPPYQQGCLILVPQKTQSRDILRLLHESYSLSPTLGWGLAFCTYGVETDSLESRQRLCSAPGSALHQRAMRMGFPTLEIKPGLTLPQPGAEAPTTPISASAAPVTGAVPAAPAARSLSSLPAAQSYFYAEDRSNGTFATPWRTEKKPSRLPAIATSAAAVIIIALATAWFLYKQAKQESPMEQSQAQATAPAVQPLPENPEEQPAQATEPTATEPEPTTTTPEPTVTTPEPTATEPEPTATEPEPTVTTPEPTATEPEPTAPEQPPAAEEISVNSLIETADQAIDPRHDAEEETKKLVITAPKAITVGAKLPPEFLDILPPPTKDIVIEHGKCSIHLGEATDGSTHYRKNADLYSLELSPGKVYLTLRCTEVGMYTLSAVGRELPTITLYVEDKTLRSITAQGNENAAMLLPIMREDGKLLPLLLLPHIEIPLRPAAVQAERTALIDKAMAIKFDRKWLKWEKMPKRQCIVDNEEIKKQSWVKKRVEENIELIPAAPSLTLQIFGFTNEIEIQRSTTPRSFICKKEEKANGAVELQFKHVFRPGRKVSEMLREYLNATWTEPNKKVRKTPAASATLANAYEVICRISAADRAPDADLMDLYRSLYENPRLGKELRTILSDQIRLTFPEPSANVNWSQYQKDIMTQLKTETNRKALRRDFEAHLSKKVTDYFHKIYQDYLSEPVTEHILRLKDVQTDKDKKRHLIWTFELEPAL